MYEILILDEACSTTEKAKLNFKWMKDLEEKKN